VGQAYNARLKTLNDQLANAKSNLEHRNDQLSATNAELETAKASLEATNSELGEASGKLTTALGDVKAERAHARRYLYTASMALVQRAEQEKQPGRVVQLLRSLIPETPDQEDLRDFEWHHLWRKYCGAETHLRGHRRVQKNGGNFNDSRDLCSFAAF